MDSKTVYMGLSAILLISLAGIAMVNDTTPPTIYATIYPTTGNYSVINVTVIDSGGVNFTMLYTNGNYTDAKYCYGYVDCYWAMVIYRPTYGLYNYTIIAYDNSSNFASTNLYAEYTEPTTTTTTTTTTSTTTSTTTTSTTTTTVSTTSTTTSTTSSTTTTICKHKGKKGCKRL